MALAPPLFRAPPITGSPMVSPVRKTSASVDKMAQDWNLIDAVMGGTKTMRAAGKAHLPQWPAEEDSSYKTRLTTATFFPAYARTVSVLTGKPFSKELTYGEEVDHGTDRERDPCGTAQ